MGGDAETLAVAPAVTPPPGGGSDSNAASPGGGKASVVVIATDQQGLLGKRATFGSQPLVVGSDADCGLRLTQPDCAGFRLTFEREVVTDDRYVVEVERAPSPVLLNDGEVRGRHDVRSSDRIIFATTGLKVLIGEDAEAKYHEEIYRMTILDGVTQVHNVRYLREALEREILRARRHARELSLIALELADAPKPSAELNVLMRRAAGAAQRLIRRDEVFARQGTNRFVAVLPETTLDRARHVGKQLVTTLASLEAPIPSTFRATTLEATDEDGTPLLARIVGA